MAKVYSFENLECWKTAKKLTIKIYQLKGRVNSDNTLRDQIRRASLSVMNNIAEGFGRFSQKEKIRFLEIAQSSASEVKSMIYLLQDLRYLNKEDIESLHETVTLCQRQTWGLIKYLKGSENNTRT